MLNAQMSPGFHALAESMKKLEVLEMNGLNMMDFVTIGHLYKVRNTYNKTFAAKAVSMNEDFIEFENSKGYRSLTRIDHIIDICDLSRVVVEGRS